MAEEKSLADLMVDEKFWLGYGQELVRAAVSAPDRRAEQLTNAIAWFWSIYSAAALVVFTTRTPALAISIPLASPVILLIVAYWLASAVRAPIRVEFDPRRPDEIEAIHHEATSQKNRMLAWAERFTGVAAACVVLAIVVALATTAPARADFYGYAGPHAEDKLVLGGSFPKQSILHVRVQTAGSAQPAAKEIFLAYRASENGEFHTQVDVPPADAYRVTVVWNEDENKVEKTITIEVKRGGE